MEELRIDQADPDPVLVRKAAEKIKVGGLVVFPTDTVYGLGACLFNRPALKRIFDIKGRESGKGLIAMIADFKDMTKVCSVVSGVADILIREFWPGPLTLVAPAAEAVPKEMTIDGSIGVRMVDSKLVRELIRAVEQPLATTSANISGQQSVVDAETAKAAMHGLVEIFIAGRCDLGIESTVVDTQTWPPIVFREGAIAKQAILEALEVRPKSPSAGVNLRRLSRPFRQGDLG